MTNSNRRAKLCESCAYDNEARVSAITAFSSSCTPESDSRQMREAKEFFCDKELYIIIYKKLEIPQLKILNFKRILL